MKLHYVGSLASIPSQVGLEAMLSNWVRLLTYPTDQAGYKVYSLGSGCL